MSKTFFVLNRLPIFLQFCSCSCETFGKFHVWVFRVSKSALDLLWTSAVDEAHPYMSEIQHLTEKLANLFETLASQTMIR